jgi:hypothetical protein
MATTDRVALANLATAKRLVADAAKILTAQGETDEASMKTIAVIDAIDRARREVELRQRAGEVKA